MMDTTNVTCRTCTRPIASPYRVYDERGRIVQGCVSIDHDGQHVTPSESARWHARPDAKALQRVEAERVIRVPVTENGKRDAQLLALNRSAFQRTTRAKAPCRQCGYDRRQGRSCAFCGASR